MWRIGRRENRILWLRTSRTVAVMTGECSHTYGLSRLNLRLFQRGAHRPTSESGIVFKTGETTKEKFVDLPLEEGLDVDAPSSRRSARFAPAISKAAPEIPCTRSRVGLSGGVRRDALVAVARSELIRLAVRSAPKSTWEDDPLRRVKAVCFAPEII